MTNAIRTQINLLRNTKSELRTAIMEKGVIVYGSDLFSTYPTRISQISDTPGTYEDDLKKLLDGSLTSYNIPDGTERIRYAAFHDYTALASVTIPASVTIIGERAFWNCSSLTSITCLSTTPPTIVGRDSAYEDLYPFKNTNNCPIYVPSDSVEAYKAAWTKYASRIQEMASTRKGRVHYKDGTTADIPLNGSSILYANELESLLADENPIVGLEVSNQCTQIAKNSGGSNYGFWMYAPELSWVRASSTVKTLGDSVFESCEHITSLDDIQLPGVTAYPTYAFQSCFGLTDANIPEGIQTVNYGCFYDCQNISSLHIPSTLTSFNDYIHKEYSTTTYAPLTSITVDQNNTTFSSVGNCLIQSVNGVYRLVLGCSTSVIPDNLTNLYIMPNAFANIVQDNSNYTVPSNVATIGSNAFGYASSVTMLSSTPCALVGSAFGNGNFPIYVPSGSLETYLADSSWVVYEDRLFERGVAKWTEQSYQCEVDETDTKTGMVTVVEKDTNPTSSTYNQTRTRTYEDLTRCNPSGGFTKITSLDDATSGKYLIVNTSANKALNASLIKDTTSTAGLNAANNMIDITIEDDTIAGDATIMNAAADYDADNKTLSWTDSDTGTTYYLYWIGSGNKFAYSGNTSPSMQYPMVAKQVYSNFTIGNSTRSLGTTTTTSSKIAFFPNTNESIFGNQYMALFKLN